jgi:hypothetical protein
MTSEQVRTSLCQALLSDLVGPFSPEEEAKGNHEVLPIPPSRWYLTGFLAPRGGQAPETDDQDSHGGELVAGSEERKDDAGSDEPEPKRPVRFPASMGLSVFLPPRAAPGGDESDSLEVEVWYADYDKVDVPLERDDNVKQGWKRVPHGPVRVRVPLSASALSARKSLLVPGSRGLALQGELRETDLEGLDQGTRVLSLFLVNDRAALEHDRDSNYVFQVKLALSYERGFVARPNRRGEASEDDDKQVLALLFRNHVEWAVGHNTSLAAPIVASDGKVRRLETTQLPMHEVYPTGHRELSTITTEMAKLAALDGPALKNTLSPLCEEYADWIDAQEGVPLRKPLEETRAALVEKARQVKLRIAAGVELLQQDEQVRRAFQYANRAMHVAAVQRDKAERTGRYKDGKKPAWRPFQLAFLLMNLGAIADPKHPDRKVADLIYFPTGGGKTEAYLGLIAFTLVLRRMRGLGTPHEGRGVAVLLRYTLRLLTLDQLGRAATLICALEELRGRYPADLGNARFTVGLWVGSSATANNLKDVHRVLHDFSHSLQSPFPLAACPWCGTDIQVANIKLVDERGKPTKTRFARCAVYCSEASCPYTEKKSEGLGIPVVFVDEQIYHEVPSFLVATVDKFAMMPWLGDAGLLFGRATHTDARRAYGVLDDAPREAKPLDGGLLPPELIVQDELHLISGPLGTMVGLYEAAIDYLSERPIDGVPCGPKVVCSTATLRRAREQIRALYGRPMTLFPPRGIDEGDNFFAREDRSRPGRLYVGVGAPGRALRAVSVRTYATMLAAAQRHFEPRGPANQAADPYMTLVGYFNSLRELSGMRRLVESEVHNRIQEIDGKRRPMLFLGPHPWAANRKLRLPEELTSRESTEKVKLTKQRLATQMGEERSLDVVLASNMISVGLDVDRLGLMVVTGQPKTTSEYIQATSRVGRTKPGLVVVCLNVMRPRDRSHYERFAAYHEAFYREVEATSVTPWSGQALDRGLPGVLLSMVRHGLAALEPPTGFMQLHDHRAQANAIVRWLVERARGHRQFHDQSSETRLAELLSKRGASFLDAWERVVAEARAGAGERTYSRMDKHGHEGRPVMSMPGDTPPHDQDERRFVAHTSLRDVEPNAHVWVRYKPLDDRS